jgi:hypothetical protein
MTIYYREKKKFFFKKKKLQMKMLFKKLLRSRNKSYDLADRRRLNNIVKKSFKKKVFKT